MNLLASLTPGGGTIRAATMVLLQTSAVILVAALIGRVALRHRADARHSLWLGALSWVLISPLVAAIADRSGIAIWTFTTPLTGPVTSEVVVPTSPVDFAGAEDPSRAWVPRGGGMVAAVEVSGGGPEPGARARVDVGPIRRDATSPGRAIAGAFALLWISGMLAGLSRIVLGYRKLGAILRHARPLDIDRHGATLAQVRDALGFDVLPPIVTSLTVREPVAIGLIRPRVILPEGLPEAISAESLGQVLVHEGAHILRGDLWVGLLQRLAGVIYWPHPLLPYLNGQLAHAREEACDNLVLRSGDRYSYSRTLVALTETCRPFGLTRPGLGLLAPRWSLSARVAGLLEPRRVLMSRTSIRMKVALASAVCLTGGAGSLLRVDGPARADETKAKEIRRPAEDPSRKPTGVWTVKGTVVDEQGRPVTGATVRTVPDDVAPGGARAGADGTFALSIVGIRHFFGGIVAELAGTTRIGLVRFDEPLDLRSISPLKIRLSPARSVRVRVQDVAGAPVPGAAVEVIDDSFQTHAMTDAHGVTILNVPTDAKVQWVIGLKSGVGFDYFENYRTRPAIDFPPLPPEVTLTLDGARTFRFKAVDSRGKPVAGVVVKPWILPKDGRTDHANVGRSVIVAATTDPHGMATLDWFPRDVNAGSIHQFLIRSNLYTCPEPPRYEQGGPTELTFRLLRDTPLSGTVRFPDGRPAPNVLLRIQGSPARMSRGYFAARTGEDGSFSLELPPEAAYMIGVDDATWAAPSLKGIVVREGQARAGQDIRLTRGAPLHGQITEGPDRRPSVGAQVSLIEEGELLLKDLGFGKSGRPPQLVRRSNTDPQGRYHFRVAPGRYTLAAPPLSGTESVAIEVKAETEIVRDMVLKNSASASYINVAVVEKTPAGERPIPRAWAFRHGIGTSNGMFRADDSGRFRMVRLPGEHILYAKDEGDRAGFAHLSEKADNVKIVISRATTISGRVVDSNGKPLAEQVVGVALAANTADFRRTLYLGVGIRTDGEGRFTFEGAPVGSEGEFNAFHHKKDRFATPRTVVSFHVSDLTPVEVPDLVVPAERSTK